MRLVIDANVAHSAGSSDVPVSLYSRECMNAVLEHDHVAVFGIKLLEEWREHASLHSRRWWRSMAARRRIESAEGDEFAVHCEPACACLEHEGWKDDLRKDYHLVQSALATDRTILSLEVRFPRYLAIACDRVRILGTLFYGNPALEGDVCIQWIKAGASVERDRSISQWAANHGTNE